MMNMFFKESADFADRNSQLFRFIHTSSAALWNLRWQVQGFVAVCPDATERDLSERFTNGSRIEASRLRETCIETPWEDQLGQFAQIVSANLIALFEGWTDELLPKFGSPELKNLVQWPSQGKFGRTRNGVGEALVVARSGGISRDMELAFYPVYTDRRRYSLSHLDGLLALYRYHKEKRNAFMHRGGVAHQFAQDAWAHASKLTRSDIGGRSAPIITQVTEGRPVIYDLRESIQLSDILRRIVHTIDSELCATQVAERQFIADWEKNLSTKRLARLPLDPVRRNRRLSKLARKAGGVTPADTEAVRRIGIRAGLLEP